MTTTTLKKIVDEFGISLDDQVRYQQNGDTAIIEVKMKHIPKPNKPMQKDSIYQLGQKPVSTQVQDGAENHDLYLTKE
jgi:hypothetical protein